MSITGTLRFACNGCEAEEEVRIPLLSSRFRGVLGGHSGFGHWEDDQVDVDALTPEGWLAFDPLTRMTYCPECILSIWPDGEPKGYLATALVAANSK